ncbi:chromate transporter [Sphingomonas sp. 35-24ZXX]|uniref:chromate transporter n=1 Tax=Sphingomonas sp. 35-24ZXX TaxID=1545915 RepID=UPI00053BDC6C
MQIETSRPTFADLLRVFVRIGCLSFGGPAGQIALMHSEVVEKHRWVDEEPYLHALNFCHLLPGPEAQQLATWIGWRLHGFKGGLAAGLLFVVPGALLMLALSALYAFAANVDGFAAVFLGIKTAVLADLATWLRDGRLKMPVHMVHGLESAPEALNLLYTSGNTGKLLVRLD